MAEKKKDGRGGNHLWNRFLAEAEGDVPYAKQLQHDHWRAIQKQNRVSHAECEHDKTKAARQKCRRDRMKANDDALAE